jgi:hypothetical protein
VCALHRARCLGPFSIPATAPCAGLTSVGFQLEDCLSFRLRPLAHLLGRYIGAPLCCHYMPNRPSVSRRPRCRFQPGLMVREGMHWQQERHHTAQWGKASSVEHAQDFRSTTVMVPLLYPRITRSVTLHRGPTSRGSAYTEMNMTAPDCGQRLPYVHAWQYVDLCLRAYRYPL